MSAAGKPAWLALTLGTAAVAGIIMGVEITLDDPVWPARGGVKGLLQACLIFFAWSLPPSALTATALIALLPRAGAGAAATLLPLLLAVGAGVQAGGLWLEALIAGAGPFPWRDLVPSAVAGALAGLASLVTARLQLGKTVHG